jgi:hypothetical protein
MSNADNNPMERWWIEEAKENKEWLSQNQDYYGCCGWSNNNSTVVPCSFNMTCQQFFVDKGYKISKLYFPGVIIWFIIVGMISCFNMKDRWIV